MPLSFSIFQKRRLALEVAARFHLFPSSSTHSHAPPFVALPPPCFMIFLFFLLFDCIMRLLQFVRSSSLRCSSSSLSIVQHVTPLPPLMTFSFLFPSLLIFFSIDCTAPLPLLRLFRLHHQAFAVCSFLFPSLLFFFTTDCTGCHSSSSSDDLFSFLFPSLLILLTFHPHTEVYRK